MKQARIISAGGCLAMLLNAGCAGVSPNSAASPFGGVVPEDAIDLQSTHPLGSPISGEALTGNRHHVRVACHDTRKGYRGSFSASGAASGPYPGTFAAHGEWKYHFGYFNFSTSASRLLSVRVSVHYTVAYRGPVPTTPAVPPLSQQPNL